MVNVGKQQAVRGMGVYLEPVQIVVKKIKGSDPCLEISLTGNLVKVLYADSDIFIIAAF